MTRDAEISGTSVAPAAAPVTHLRFETGRTVLALAGTPALVVPVGPQALAARHWRAGTPSALQIEQAIDEVEMALMSQRLAQASRGWLASADPWLCALPGLQLAGDSLTRDAVELLFNALAAMAEAGRSTAVGLVTTGASAAALLILRECMHHLGFEGIVALPPRADDAVP